MKKILLFIVCWIVAAATVQAQNQTQKSTSIVTIGGESYYVHTVKPGDTFYSLCKVYDTDEDSIRASNPHVADGLQADQVIKIPVVKASEKPLSDRKRKRLFDIHTINQGETAYSIAKRYGVGLDVLMEDNEGFDPAHLSIGQQINIRKASQGKSDTEEIEEQIESYKDALNSVSDRFTHHVVEKGETLYSLGKRFGLPVDSIAAYNEPILKAVLKEGSILRVPIPQQGTDRPVRDSLPQHPGTEPATESASIRPVDVTGVIKVAMLLPLKGAGVSGRQFLEFYQGALLALEELKTSGISVKVDLFNTGKSAAETAEILQQPELQNANLIIGPVYDECFPPVAAFAAQHGIPVVSPLAVVESVNSPLLFQAAPGPSVKNDKLRNEFAGDKNVIVISATGNDSEFAAEIQPLIPQGAHRFNYVKGMGGTALEGLLSGEKENVIVVLASDETNIDGILAYVSSVQNSLTSRSIKNPAIRVIGSSRWARLQNIERNLFFKLNLRYVTSYHADRGNERVLNFDRRYVSAFNSLPSLYAYRGYDIAKLFIGGIKMHGADFASFLNRAELPLLQTPYRFVQKSPGHKYENDEWALVCYNNNYTIEVK